MRREPAVSSSSRPRDAMPTLVLSMTPLDRAALGRVASESEVRALSVPMLREMGPRAFVRALRERRWTAVVVVGDTDELTIYGAPLSSLALLARSSRREALDLTTGTRHPVRAGRTAWALAQVLVASLLGRRALRGKAAEMRRLARVATPRWEGATRRVLYLKSGPFGNVKVGGMVGHVAGVANAWHRRGAEVRLLAAAPQAEVVAGIEQVTVPAPRRWALPLELNVVRYSARFRDAARALARRWRPDLVYQRYSPHDLTGAALRATGVPWVLEYNGSEVWVQRSWGRPMRYEQLAREVELAALRTADLVVTVSEPLRQEVIADGVPEERVLFYPNCIDPAVFDPSRFTVHHRQQVRSRFALAPDDFVFTFLGTFGQWHGTDVLADAIRDLVDHDGRWLREQRVRFLIVGNGMLASEVARRLDGAEEFVRLPGLLPQHEAPGLLAASDILLSPHKPNADGSAFFGSPTKLIEYMAMARPIVASDLDQIGDIARGWQPLTPRPSRDLPSDLMLLVRPGDAADLVRGIRAARGMTDGERADMGARARAAVLRGFTWDANVAAVVARLTSTILTAR